MPADLPPGCTLDHLDTAWADDPSGCEACDGTGQIEDPDGEDDEDYTCDTCGGTGRYTEPAPEREEFE